VKTTVYMRDVGEFDAMNRVYVNTSKRVPRRLASQSKRSLLCQESMWRLTLLLISPADGRRAHEEPQLARPDVHDLAMIPPSRTWSQLHRCRSCSIISGGARPSSGPQQPGFPELVELVWSGTPM